jgi:uncharacterized protein
MAAAQGYAPAEASLGLAYAEGHGVPQDYREAAKWYRLASAQGNPSAQASLGLMYANGAGVPRDIVRAHMWLTLGAVSSGDAGPAINDRDRIASRMTAEQIAKANEMARRCQQSKFKDCD